MHATAVETFATVFWIGGKLSIDLRCSIRNRLSIRRCKPDICERVQRNLMPLDRVPHQDSFNERSCRSTSSVV